MQDHRFDQSGRQAATRSLTIDTGTLPAAQRFAAWQAFWSPVIDTRPAQGDGRGFLGRATLSQLGPLTLARVDADAALYRRSAGQARWDGLDHWLIGLPLQQGAVARESLHLGTLMRGLRLQGAARGWAGLFIPPGAMPRLAPIFALPRGMPAADPPARLLAGMLPRFATALDRLDADEAVRLEGALAGLLDACLRAWEPQPGMARAQLQAARRARVLALIGEALHEPMLGPDLLSRRAGLSRSELYRCFAPLGGVARAIQRARLRRAHSDLARRDGRAGVARIGEAVGFPDASSFTRAFRREFGYTPTDLLLRRAAPAERPAASLASALGLA